MHTLSSSPNLVASTVICLFLFENIFNLYICNWVEKFEFFEHVSKNPKIIKKKKTTIFKIFPKKKILDFF